MKLVLAIAALALGGTAATAQTHNSAQTAMPPGDGITRQGTNPEGQPCTPAGYNPGMWVYPACVAMGGPLPGLADYPPCTRWVTDRCVQTYTRWTDRNR